MAALGNLIVSLILQTAQYTQGLNKADQDTLKFAKGVQDGIDRAKRATSDFLGGVVTGALAAVASYQTVTAVVNGVRDAIDRLDNISKLSQRIGIATDELQELALAGELSDVTLEALGGSVKKLSVFMTEVAGGSKAQSDIFKALGVEAKNSDGSLRGTNEVLSDLADVFSKLEDGPTKTTLAIKLFGKAGADMIPLLNGGKKALEESREEARKFGLVIGGETLKAAESFNDNLTRLGKITQGTFNQIAEAALPVLVEFSSAMVAAASDTDSLNQEAQRLGKDGTLFEWARSVSVGLTHVIDASEGAWRALKSVGQVAGAVIASVSASIASTGNALDKALRLNFRAAFAEMSEGGRQQRAIWASVGDDLGKTLGDQLLGEKIRGRLADMKAFGGAVSDVGSKAKPTKALLDALAGSASKAAEGLSAFQKFLEKINEYNVSLDAQFNQLDKLSKAEEWHAQLVANATEETKKLNESERERLKTEVLLTIVKEKRNAAAEKERKATADALKEQAKFAEELAKATVRLQEEARAEEDATAQIGMSKSAIAERKAARLEEHAVIVEGMAIKALDKDLDEAQFALYQQQAKALRDRAAAMRAGGAKAEGLDTLKKIDDYLDPSKAKSFGDALTDAFAGAGNALAKLGNSLDDYARKQGEINKLREELNKSPGISAEERIKREIGLSQKQSELQIDSYAQMASAAKGFFEEGSKGYKVLEAAETAFRAYQLASDLIKGFSAAKVAIATQAQGEPYSAWIRMAAMAAAMAALGYAVSSGGGGGGPSAASRQEAQGTGTVFGDASAKSESISRSIELLGDNSTIGLRYSSQMVASLRNIESAMAGLANLVLGSQGITTGKNLNIFEGTLSVNKGDPLFGLLGFDDLGRKLPLIGGIIGDLQALWGKTKQEISDAGLTIRGTVAQLSGGQGVQQYADVKTTSSSFFGLKKDVSTGTQFGTLDGAIAEQFGLVFENLQRVMVSAAGALGKDGQAVGEAIAKFVIDIPRLSLKDLKGQELQAAIAAAISAASDSAAQAAVSGLNEFRRVGEGYLETVIRVATGVETAADILDRLGVSAVNFADLTNKQADVGSEIVRQSIAAFETVGGAISGVGEIIATINGSAADLADTYGALIDVRDAMRLVGSDATSLGVEMIRAAGGIDALRSGLRDYFENYFTEAEKAAAQTERLSGQFERLGVSIPASRAEFRALVEGIDTTTESGAALYAKVIGLSGAFAELNPILDEAAAMASKMGEVMNGLDSIIGDFLSGPALVAYRSGRIADTLAQGGITVNPSALADVTRADIVELWHSVGAEGKLAIQAAYGAWVELQNLIKEQRIAELLGPLGVTADELLGAYNELNPAAENLVETWRRTKDEAQNLADALAEIDGTRAVSAIDAFKAAISQRTGLQGVIDTNASAAFDLKVGQGGGQAVELLRRREAELWRQFASTGSPEVAAAITKTTLQRIQLEGSIEQAGQQRLLDAKFEAEKLAYEETRKLQEEVNKVRIEALEKEIDAAERFRGLAENLDQFLGGLRAGNLSAYSPGRRLDQQRRLFDASLESGKDPEQQLNAYLDQAQRFYGGATAEYATIFNSALAQYEEAIRSGAAGADETIADAKAQLAAIQATAAAQPELQKAIVDTSDREITALGDINLVVGSKVDGLGEIIAAQRKVLDDQLTELGLIKEQLAAQINQHGEAYRQLIGFAEQTNTRAIEVAVGARVAEGAPQ